MLEQNNIIVEDNSMSLDKQLAMGYVDQSELMSYLRELNQLRLSIDKKCSKTMEKLMMAAGSQESSPKDAMNKLRF